jgi:3'-5' exonuclease
VKQIICLDWETHWAADYTLTKVTTESYIRDPRFEAIMLGVKMGDNPSFVVPKHSIADWLAGIDWSDKAILCQNVNFDGAILSWHYGVKPMAWMDTMAMSRALWPHARRHSLKAIAERLELGIKGDEVLNTKGKYHKDFTDEELRKFAEYCQNDVDLTYAAFQKMAPGFPLNELRLIDLTTRMFTEPRLVLNKPKLVEHLEQTKLSKAALMQTVISDFGLANDMFADGELKKHLMSNDKFAELLRKLGVEPPTKVSVKIGKVAWAFAKTDTAFLELEEHEDPRVQSLVAARLGNKTTLEETRTERLIGIADRGLFPVPLRYAAAHTLRWGGCLVADTEVLVYDPVMGVTTKKIVDVLLDDLVWDGVEFVAHEGVVFSGYSEVITHDGVTGTEDHVVFTDAGEISLREAMQRGCTLENSGSPTKNQVDAAREYICNCKF